MSRYCLDTSAYSHFKRGDSQIVELVDRAEWIGIPTIVLGELRVGFLLGGRLVANEGELREFLASPVVEVVGVDQEAARHYANIVIDLRRAGTPIPTNDIWIAAVTAREGGLVLSYDDHFKKISRVGSVILSTSGQ
ncbi:MAG: tRNA(fMet)-specific endonuclease VapC [Thermoanaerobaculia bacterium]|jgi:tRNA(fMet)-specific endonuclease VapC|nr:tRNA(fMet)-specific endonuclease VapC [Thermoanaerobaculia bacterium]